MAPRVGCRRKPEPQAQVADLTAILRQGHNADRLDDRPLDLRIIACRTPARPDASPNLAKTPAGNTARRDQRDQRSTPMARRLTPHIEDNIKERKTLGAPRLPTAHDGP